MAIPNCHGNGSCLSLIGYLVHARAWHALRTLTNILMHVGAGSYVLGTHVGVVKVGGMNGGGDGGTSRMNPANEL